MLLCRLENVNSQRNRETQKFFFFFSLDILILESRIVQTLQILTFIILRKGILRACIEPIS